MSTIDVYILHTSLVKEKYDFVFSFVEKSRQEKALKFAHEKDRLLSLGAAYLMKKHLPNGRIIENKNRKPYLEGGPFFNISHSGEYIVFASHPTREVGIDIEQVREDKVDAIKYVLTNEEKDLTDPVKLFQIWSNKESLIKCLSSSLKDIRTISGLPFDGVHRIDKEDCFTRSTVYQGYALSITLKEKDPFDVNMKKLRLIIEQEQYEI